MNMSLPRFSRLTLLLASAGFLVAQAEHITPFTGTWKLNVEKSKFSGPAPKAVTVTSAPDGAFSVSGTNAEGKPIKWSHAWSGGAEVPVEGIPDGTIISKMQNNTNNDEMKVGGKTVQTVHAVVSPDGRTLTATLDGTDRQGHSFHHVEVFDKQ